MDNFTIVRQVKISELLVNRTIFGPNVLITLKFKSKIDLYDNLDLVRDGIRAWKSMHKFLQAKVIKNTHDEFYFAIDKNAKIHQTLNNVQFLRIRNQIDTSNYSQKMPVDSDLIYQLVFEKIMSQKIDFEQPHESLWSLSFVELQEVNEQNEDIFVYEVYWLIHHVIVDGLSAKENMILLLDLIRKRLKGEEIEQQDFGVYPSTETIFRREINLAKEIMKTRPEPAPIFKPEFIDPSKAKFHSSTNIDRLLTKRKINSEDYFLVDLNKSGEMFATFSELIRISREVNHQKPKKFIIDANVYLTLKQKSKEENVKMTSVLNSILWITIFRLCKMHNTHLNRIRTWTSVSFRRFRSEKEINKNMLGYCAGGCLDSCENIFKDVLDDSEVLEKFWQFARQNDKKLTIRVTKSPEIFGNQPRKELADNELLNFTGLSNIGELDTTEVEADKLFEIENFFSRGFSPVEHVRNLFFNFVITVKNRICWLLSFNSFFFDHLLIDEAIDLITDLCSKLSAVH